MHWSIQIPTITINEAQSLDYTLIDVRTPAEFEEFHIPGAINIPIFTNEERIEVGTIYKQAGKEQAKEIGIQLLGQKLPVIYAQIKRVYETTGQPLVIYCWRGGMRSKSVVVTMSALDIPVAQLTGGIRSYRQLITDTFEQQERNPKPFLVIEGNTGVGKTKILQALSQLGYPVLDLENLANHRGSAFGQIGVQPRSQKSFESLLYERIKQLQDTQYWIIEAESKRLGNIVLPEFLLQGKERGTRIHVDAPLAYRVSIICEMYEFAEHKERFHQAFSRISKRIPDPIRMEIEQAFVQDDAKTIVRLLLQHYYDPKYEFAASQYVTPVYPVFVKTLEEGVRGVQQKIGEIVINRQLSAQ